jgi:hypothetical protein
VDALWRTSYAGRGVQDVVSWTWCGGQGVGRSKQDVVWRTW